MTERRNYEKPSMKVFELKQKPTLLAGSDPTSSLPGMPAPEYI